MEVVVEKSDGLHVPGRRSAASEAPESVWAEARASLAELLSGLTWPDMVEREARIQSAPMFHARAFGALAFSHRAVSGAGRGRRTAHGAGAPKDGGPGPPAGTDRARGASGRFATRSGGVLLGPPKKPPAPSGSAPDTSRPLALTESPQIASRGATQIEAPDQRPGQRPVPSRPAGDGLAAPLPLGMAGLPGAWRGTKTTPEGRPSARSGGLP